MATGDWTPDQWDTDTDDDLFTITPQTKWSDLAENLPSNGCGRDAMVELSRRQGLWNAAVRARRAAERAAS